MMCIWCVSCFTDILCRLIQLLGCGVQLTPTPTKAWYYHHILGSMVQLVACWEQAIR